MHAGGWNNRPFHGLCSGPKCRHGVQDCHDLPGNIVRQFSGAEPVIAVSAPPPPAERTRVGPAVHDASFLQTLRAFGNVDVCHTTKSSINAEGSARGATDG